MNATAVQLSHFRAVEQAQQSLEIAANVRLDAKSVSINSERSICISPTGSRCQLSNCYAEACGYDKNARRRESDQPDISLLGAVDVDIGGKQQNFAVKTKPPRGRRGIQIPKSLIDPNQSEPAPIDTALARIYFSIHQRFCS